MFEISGYTHPADSIRCTKGEELKGVKIIYGVTGSIAAVESVKIIRELIRYGAEVVAVMSEEAKKIITPDSLLFATGNPVITSLTGMVEHVSYPTGRVVYLIAPSTANTISKIACGIDDTPPTSFATVCIGRKIKIIIAPAMHNDMIKNPIISENLARLSKMGIEFVFPKMEENEAKLASAETILDHVIRAVSTPRLENKRVLIVTGSSMEPIDDVRYITNHSTGITGLYLAKKAFYEHAFVDVFYGKGMVHEWPNYFNVHNFTTIESLKNLIGGHKWDIAIVPAALSDFTFQKVNGKIPSDRDLEIRMKHTDKILPLLRKNVGLLVGFKAEYDMNGDVLISKARDKIKEFDLDMVVSNNINEVSDTSSVSYIITKKGKEIQFKGNKKQLADAIFNEIFHLG
ncbi:MAG: bifunctional phosphopantothenoylcysteine decarboxylase/phosphopantothenate--cysteine ligase CoaBC [Thermoplasmata archaeon]